ncbi:FGGY family carbohydrate kinase, partial [Bacillus licheniformis]|uniref:FGGY family carbohydrate kinase n=1 Tax=Bacillus licheniformis TaxID=1402 RepID=UPI0021BD25F7
MFRDLEQALLSDFVVNQPALFGCPCIVPQDPAEWADKTKEAIKELVGHFPGKASQIKGVSFSGQMHGLVLLNGKGEVLRNAILWNDT